MRISDWSSDVCSSDLMLLTTGSKSEMSIGYATIYGDMAGGYSVLKDAYKTTVFDLSRWRNEKRPSFGLGPEGSIMPERVIADRKSVVWGKRVSVRVDPGGRRIIKIKK